METSTKRTFGAAGVILFLASLPALGSPRPQEGPPPDEERPVRELLDEARGGGMDELEAKMRELFGKVERRLREIDVLLSDASAGDTSKLTELREAGIDDLLRASLKQGRQLQKEIQEIIDITPT